MSMNKNKMLILVVFLIILQTCMACLQLRVHYINDKHVHIKANNNTLLICNENVPFQTSHCGNHKYNVTVTTYQWRAHVGNLSIPWQPYVSSGNNGRIKIGQYHC